MAVLISAYQLEKAFGSRTLFRGVTFSIDSGQRIGLIGPNGAGKSTLLKMLAKTEDCDSGQISWGKNIRIGYLEQSPTFGTDDTVMSALLSGAPDPHEYMTLAKAEELMSKLSLDTEKVTRETLVSTLSGGWKKKVALGRELMKEPDVLLLDEPTNHLDLESIFWFEDFLATQTQMAVLTITHDRLFLQNVANFIYDLDPKYKDGLLKIQGSYADYVESRDILLEGQKSQESARANDLRHEMAWLRRGAKARQTKQKARIEKTYDLMDEVADLRNRNRSTTIDLEISAAGRSPKKLIEATKISKVFGERELFKDLTLTITPRSRIGLLGRNGCGKSTLIRTLLGDISPDHGTVKINEQLQVNYFEQHRDSLDPKDTLQKAICPDGDYVHLGGKPIYVKSYLDRFHFRREQHDMLVEKLSGGEQSRLLIARLMLTSANVLVLDEPTNDLDIATLDVLKEALDMYQGALVVVSHDRFFMEQVCDTIIAFVDATELLPTESPGTLISFAGYLQWQDWREKRMLELEQLTRKNKTATNAANKESGKKRKLSFKEQRELDGMEELILSKEGALTGFQKELDDPATAANSHRLMELTQKISDLQSEIEKLYSRWAELGM
jgi:ATP-binding cassette subfamily F protein uup